MCIIIDINVLAAVFDEDTPNHNNFKPVFDWIMNGKGKVVFGGTQYMEELQPAYKALFLQLKKAGKAVFVQSDFVDKEHQIVAQQIIHPDFDDPHLVGLLRVSGCRLICSLDKRAYPYFRHSLFFKPAVNKPRIYSSRTNVSLLCDKHIADLCKPCSPTTNSQKVIMKK